MTIDNEVQRSLGRVEGKVDQILSAINQHFEDDKINFSEIKERLNSAEKKIWLGQGGAAILGSLFAIIFRNHT